jgi:hypothetical protein
MSFVLVDSAFQFLGVDFFISTGFFFDTKLSVDQKNIFPEKNCGFFSLLEVQLEKSGVKGAMFLIWQRIIKSMSCDIYETVFGFF